MRRALALTLLLGCHGRSGVSPKPVPWEVETQAKERARTPPKPPLETKPLKGPLASVGGFCAAAAESDPALADPRCCALARSWKGKATTSLRGASVLALGCPRRGLLLVIQTPDGYFFSEPFATLPAHPRSYGLRFDVTELDVRNLGAGQAPRAIIRFASADNWVDPCEESTRSRGVLLAGLGPSGVPRATPAIVDEYLHSATDCNEFLDEPPDGSAERRGPIDEAWSLGVDFTGNDGVEVTVRSGHPGREQPVGDYRLSFP